jgi:hypothetical protein
MGCDIDLTIEVLVGDRWLPRVFIGTKTSTGGYPLVPAAFELSEVLGIHGKYGVQKPILDQLK